MRVVWKILLPAALAAAAICAATSSQQARQSASVSRKLDLIDSGRLRPGTRVDFPASDLNAWLRDEAEKYFPGAVHNLRLELANNAATGYADIDFLKLRQSATGESPGWLMRSLFAGQRPVVVRAHFVSSNGGARVDLDLVQISGVPIEGGTLDFLIRNYVRPTFPEMKLSEWFRLEDRVDHVTTTPSGASIFIGR